MPFQNILFSKEFLECIGYILNYILKLKRDLGLVSGAHFEHI